MNHHSYESFTGRYIVEFPEIQFDFANPWDQFSLLVMVFLIAIVRKKIFIQYFEESNPSRVKRLGISFLCGVAVAFAVLSVGVILQLLGVITGTQHPVHTIAALLTLFGVGLPELMGKLTD